MKKFRTGAKIQKNEKFGLLLTKKLSFFWQAFALKISIFGVCTPSLTCLSIYKVFKFFTVSLFSMLSKKVSFFSK